MRNRLILFLTLFMIVFSPVFVLVSIVKAAEMMEAEPGEDLTINEEVDDDLYVSGEENVYVRQRIGGDLFVAGGDIFIEDIVEADVYAAGGTITINDSVYGDVFVGGGKIKINGDVEGKVYVGGGDIRIKGKVSEDIFVGGGKVVLEGRVGDDVRVFGGIVEVEGDVWGDLIAGAGTLEISGDVYGDLQAGSDNVTINSSFIGGDLTTYEGADVYINPDTYLDGEQIEKDERLGYSDFSDVEFPSIARLGLFGAIGKLIWNLVQAIGFIFLGLLVFHFAPVKTDQTLAKLTTAQQKIKSFGVGCLVFLLMIPIAIILFLSVMGWPILGVLLALAFIANLLTTVFVGTKFGQFVFRLVGVNSLTASLILGVFMLQILTAIPCFGNLLSFFVFFAGIGALVRVQYFKYKKSQGSLKQKPTPVKKKSGSKAKGKKKK